MIIPIFLPPLQMIFICFKVLLNNKVNKITVLSFNKSVFFSILKMYLREILSLILYQQTQFNKLPEADGTSTAYDNLETFISQPALK